MPSDVRQQRELREGLEHLLMRQFANPSPMKAEHSLLMMDGTRNGHLALMSEACNLHELDAHSADSAPRGDADVWVEIFSSAPSAPRCRLKPK